jgi:membrane protein DedA with SNARE-associated domain
LRLGIAARTVLVLGLAVHLHHRFQGPPVDYLGLGVAAFASWVGVPGPGEPLLIAAGVLAARHRLDLGSTLLIAFLGASAGGVVGWLAGMAGGRRIVTARGPLRKTRLKAVARGEEIFQRVPVLAILLTPSWVAGIHRVSAVVYLPTNFASAVVWTGGIGLGAYFAGPPVIDVVHDVGLVLGLGIMVFVLAGIGLEIYRRRRRRTTGPGSPTPSASDSEAGVTE